MHRKGEPKTGGRKKGTPNKTTSAMKDVIQGIVSEYMSKEVVDDGNPYERHFAADMARLEPKDRLDAMIKLMAFVTPKPQSVALGLIGGEKKKTIEDTLNELAKENEI